MPPTSRPGHFRWQTEGRTYASRVGKTTWEEHESRIRSLHADGRTKNEIIEVLDAEHGFRPSYGQLRKRIDRWMSKASSSSTTASPIQRQSNAIRSCFTSLRRQFDLWDSSSRSNAHLPQDEELVFRTFTSVLDEESDEARSIPSPGPGVTATETDDRCEHQRPWRNEASPTPQVGLISDTILSQLPPQATNEAAHESSIPVTQVFTNSSSGTRTSLVFSHTKEAPNTQNAPNQVDHPLSLLAINMVVDSSDDEEQDIGTGPLLNNRWSASTDSKDFQEFSTRLCRQPRKRPRCYRPSDVEQDGTNLKVHKKIRKRIIGICCKCSGTVCSSKCKACQHERCEKCREDRM